MTASAGRRALLARVHIAAKELRLDREAYGEVLTRVTGRDSAAVLSDAQITLVLGEFKRLGWDGSAARPKSGKPAVRLIYGLWKELGPHLAEPSREALRSFVRRQTRSTLHPEGVDAPEFLNAKQANVVIEGLKAWLRRAKAAAPADAPAAVPVQEGA